MIVDWQVNEVLIKDVQDNFRRNEVGIYKWNWKKCTIEIIIKELPSNLNPWKMGFLLKNNSIKYVSMDCLLDNFT